MSGHSKWSTIKRQKGAADKKRGNLFTKLAHAISVAVQEGGKDPSANIRLRVAIDQAKQANMPKQNIERAIQRGAGELGGQTVQQVAYEGFGPGGVALLIVGATDNTNRAIADVRHVLTKHSARLGERGSVQWMFEQVGVLTFTKDTVPEERREAFELAVIEAGAEDMQEGDGELLIITKPDRLTAVNEQMQRQNFAPQSMELTFLATNPLDVDRATHEKLEKLTEALLDLDDIQQVYSTAA